MIGRPPESLFATEGTDSRGGRAGCALASCPRFGAAVLVGFLLLAWTPMASADPEPDGATTSDDDGASDAADLDSTTPDSSTPGESADALADAVSADAPGGDAGGGTADAKPPYDAGDGLTPLASLPTWGEGEDHDGCSCRSADGAGHAAAAAPWVIAAFAWIRSRRSRGVT